MESQKSNTQDQSTSHLSGSTLSQSDIEIPSEKAAEAKVLDDIFDQLCAIVTQEGPHHLIRGCTQLEANTAILGCIERLKNQRDLAFRIIDQLPTYFAILPYTETQAQKNLKDYITSEIEELKCLRQTTG